MSDLTTTQIFATGEKNITATKMNNIIGGAVIQPDFYASKPTASSVNPTDQLLILSGGAYAQAPFSTIVNSVGNSMGPQITAVRLRSFNALGSGNPNFEVDQRNAGIGLVNPAGGTLVIDRWSLGKAGSMTANTNQLSAGAADGLVPGTSFQLSQKYLRITLTGQETTLGASDFLHLTQNVEGPLLRELIRDVHSVSILCRSSVANLKFGIALRDPPTIGKSLTKLCALSTAQTWTLITLPNIPVWPAGNFSLVPGNAGYIFTICLAAGSTLTAPANDTWQNANVFGALGQDNFAGQAVNSTFDIAFIQHEPGAPTTPMDLDFDTNLSRCQRYFTKSYPYSVQPGSVSSVGQVRFWSVAGFAPNNMHVPFKRTLAKAPTTVTGYSSTTGVANTLRDEAAGADKTITSAQAVGDSGFGGFAVTSPNAANWYGSFQYTADTGW